MLPNTDQQEIEVFAEVQHLFVLRKQMSQALFELQRTDAIMAELRNANPMR